jgi:hypothetical protein
MGPSVSKGSGEQSLARTLYPRLERGWLLLADRLYYGWADWCAAADSGADLLWRVKGGVGLPFLELLPDGSWRSVLVQASVKGRRREALVQAARRGEDLDPALARHVRVIEYEVADRGEDALIALVTTITGWQAAPAPVLAAAYHERWQHETASAQLKTVLRGPGRILRSGSPPLVEQEIWGYLLTAWAISALICDAAAAAWIGPDRVSFTRTVRIVRRAVGPAFPPLSRLKSSSPAPAPRSPARRTSTRAVPTAPTPASSNAGGPAPIPSRHHTTTAPGTTGHPPSDSPTRQTRRSHNQPAQAKRH